MKTRLYIGIAAFIVSEIFWQPFVASMLFNGDSWSKQPLLSPQNSYFESIGILLNTYGGMSTMLTCEAFFVFTSICLAVVAIMVFNIATD